MGRWMDKELVVHIQNGILLSYNKEHIWISSNETDKPEAYYTEWSKSERERQLLYINSYIWNLERWYQQSYMQGSKGDTNTKNNFWTQWEKGKEQHWNIHITTCKTDDHCEFDAWSKAHKAGALGQPREIGWGWGRERGSGLGGHMYTYGWFMLTYGKKITLL